MSNTNQLEDSLTSAPDGLPLKIMMMQAVLKQHCNNLEATIGKKSKVAKRIYSTEDITKNQLFYAHQLEADVKDLNALIYMVRDYLRETDQVMINTRVKIGQMIQYDADLFASIDRILNIRANE